MEYVFKLAETSSFDKRSEPLALGPEAVALLAFFQPRSPLLKSHVVRQMRVRMRRDICEWKSSLREGKATLCQANKGRMLFLPHAVLSASLRTGESGL
ncbi:hypothetical protein ACOMHN_020509 [Nucella lapillus]